jgi:hypothetical protein
MRSSQPSPTSAIGTILSYVMLKGLGRCLQSKQVLQRAGIA